MLSCPKQFILAGKAIFTIVPSERFSETYPCLPHYTYKVSKCKDKPFYFISLLTGPDNLTDYTYLGLLFNNNNKLEIKLTKKSRYENTSVPVLLLKAIFQRLNKNIELPLGTIRHEGRCGRCGRVLTVPESIDRGIGPECWKATENVFN